MEDGIVYGKKEECGEESGAVFGLFHQSAEAAFALLEVSDSGQQVLAVKIRPECFVT